MNILNTRQFNEKLNIQPIPRNRLNGGFYSLYKTKDEMRANFKTGDIAVISEGRFIGNTYDEYNAKLQVYISYEDWMKDEKYYMGETGMCFLNKDYVGEGVFVSIFGDKYNNYEYLKSFDRNFEIKNKDNIHRIYAVYRIPSIVKTPIDFEHIGNKFKDSVNRFSLLWARGTKVNEKLDIQPIPRERLHNHIVHYNSAMDMRANFKTGDLALIGKPNSKHIGVYISKEDIENETYDKYFGFPTALHNTRFYKDGVFIIFYKHSPFDAGRETFTRTDLAQLDSNLTQNGKDYCIWEVRRFVNLKLPLDVEYFKEQPIYKAVKIWER